MAKLSKKESELNEQDSLQDMLNTEKMLMDNYLLAIKQEPAHHVHAEFQQGGGRSVHRFQADAGKGLL